MAEVYEKEKKAEAYYVEILITVLTGACTIKITDL
jgi:hypothetical protein